MEESFKAWLTIDRGGEATLWDSRTSLTFEETIERWVGNPSDQHKSYECELETADSEYSDHQHPVFLCYKIISPECLLKQPEMCIKVTIQYTSRPPVASLTRMNIGQKVEGLSKSLNQDLLNADLNLASSRKQELLKQISNLDLGYYDDKQEKGIFYYVDTV